MTQVESEGRHFGVFKNLEQRVPSLPRVAGTAMTMGAGAAAVGAIFGDWGFAKAGAIIFGIGLNALIVNKAVSKFKNN